MASVSVPVPFAQKRLRITGLSHWVVLAAVLLLVVYPVFLIILNSFQLSRPGQPAVWSLENWQYALSDPSLMKAVWNTILLTVVRQGIAFPAAIILAWLLARTDLPGSEWLEFVFWIAFFLPHLPVTLGWIMLLDPQYGLLNQLIALLPFVDKGPFNIYSFWGIVWAHIGGGTIAIKVMLLTPAFRNMDASLEEASKIAGASALGTLVRVIIPVMAPTLVVTVLLSMIHSLQAFEVELILGLPFRFFVFSTQIYALIHQEPPLFPAATALSSLILGIVMPFIFLQRWVVNRRRYTTVTSHFKGHKTMLRRWRWPAFILVLAVTLTCTVIPFAFLAMGTFMRLFGFFNLPAPWTMMHWSRVLGDPIFLKSVRDTLLLGGGTALVGVILYVLIAYVIIRTRFKARGAVDFVSWLPSTLPGIILGIGLLWVFLGNPVFRSLYGTIILLIVATVISSMPLGVNIIKSNLTHLGNELEEAAWVSGDKWVTAFIRVVIPIILPTLMLVGTVSFIHAARNVSTVALLATSATQPLSLLQLGYMVEGRYESAAVVGVIVVGLTTGIGLAARLFGLRVGLARG